MKLDKRMGKNDVIVLAITAVVLVGIWLFFFLGHQNQGDYIQIMVDGTLYGTYALSQEQTIEIVTGEDENQRVTNQLTIRDGYADMIEADCPDQLCVHQKAISKDKENLVCLPNRVVVTVVSDTQTGVDAIAQ